MRADDPPGDSPAEIIGSRIGRIRRKRGLSQIELARKCGRNSERFIGDIENARRPMSAKYRAPLAQALGIPEDELFSPNPDQGQHEPVLRMIFGKPQIFSTITTLAESARQSLKVFHGTSYGFNTEPGNLVQYRQLVSRRILNKSLEVKSIDDPVPPSFMEDHDRLHEIVGNILRYHGCKFECRQRPPMTPRLRPNFDCVIFDDNEAMLFESWEQFIGEGATSIRLSGLAVRDFLSGFWAPVWNDSLPLHDETGLSDIAAAFFFGTEASKQKGPVDWTRFQKKAMNLKISDGAPPLI